MTLYTYTFTLHLNSEEIINEIQQQLSNSEWSRMSLDDVPHSIQGLKLLLVCFDFCGLSLSYIDLLKTVGAWKSVFKLSSKLIQEVKYPHLKMRLYIYNVLSLLKMKDNLTAMTIFEEIGDFQDPKYTYEAYPELYPGKTGSFIPFSLKIMCGEVLYNIGKDMSLNYLFSLKSYCCSRYVSLQDSGVDDDTPFYVEPIDDIYEELNENSIRVWKERECRLASLIISKYVQRQDILLALDLALQLYKVHPNPVLLFSIGKLYLQLADVESATQILEKLKQDNNETPDYLMLSALIKVIRGNYSEALYALTKILSVNPNHIEAIHNQALCQMYLGNINQAIMTLEDVVFSNPKVALDITIVNNLWFMYDLVSDKNFDKRTKILQLIKDHVEDSFPLTALKL